MFIYSAPAYGRILELIGYHVKDYKLLRHEHVDQVITSLWAANLLSPSKVWFKKYDGKAHCAVYLEWEIFGSKVLAIGNMGQDSNGSIGYTAHYGSTATDLNVYDRGTVTDPQKPYGLIKLVKELLVPKKPEKVEDTTDYLSIYLAYFDQSQKDGFCTYASNILARSFLKEVNKAISLKDIANGVYRSQFQPRTVKEWTDSNGGLSFEWLNRTNDKTLIIVATNEGKLKYMYGSYVETKKLKLIDGKDRFNTAVKMMKDHLESCKVTNS